MTWFMTLTLRIKLLAGFGVILLSLAVVVAIGYAGIGALRETQRSLFEEQFANAVDLKDIRSNQNAISADIAMMILLAKASDQERFQRDVKARTEEVDATLKQLLDRNRSNPALFSRIQEFNSVRNAYREAWNAQIIPLIAEGKTEEAKKILLGPQNERSQKMRALADELVADAEKAARSDLTQAEQLARETFATFAISGGIGLAVGIVLAAFLGRVIGRVSQELREGANVLASSASEIVATTTQVASGAAETAAAVNETTSTVEEVK
ncbi:MAG: MCP four helix bundle domain-containing protein, partial [Betaproteobacteria bacterium]|nr:MCP four helix bundle domain-containing protein [Betaproteobacteria bacterium]